MKLIEEFLKSLCDKYDSYYNPDEPFSATNHKYRLYMLLSIAETLLPFPYECPVDIKESKYGRGLFANRNISEGEIVCIYPCHTVVFETGEDKGISVSLKEEENKADLSYAYRMENDVILYGNPDIYVNTWFSGHLTNDLCYNSYDIKENPDDLEVGNFICKYNINMVSKANVKFDTLIHRHYKWTFLTAVKDIKKGDELSLPYRYNYWLSKKGRKDIKKEDIQMYLLKYLSTKPVSFIKFYDRITKKIKV
jgi:hypothetical protein